MVPRLPLFLSTKRRSVLPLLAPVALISLLWSCSGSDGTHPDSRNGEDTTSTDSTGEEGEGTTGSSRSTGDTSSTDDSTSTGDTSSTGSDPTLSSDLDDRQCRGDLDCSEGASCYHFDAPPRDICGAPNWCGQCTCPSMPPYGAGNFCDESTPCPDPDASPSTYGTASICDPTSNSCGTCISDEDCGTGQCVSDSYSGGKTCVGCQQDADCETGTCSINHVCVPECSGDHDCERNEVCSAKERCEPRLCKADSDCHAQSECLDGRCSTRVCNSDDNCDAGYCVLGLCSDAPGRCEWDTVP